MVYSEYPMLLLVQDADMAAVVVFWVFFAEAFVPRRDLWMTDSSSRVLIKLNQEASCRVR